MKKGMLIFIVLLYLMQACFLTSVISILNELTESIDPKLFFVIGLVIMVLVFIVGMINIVLAIKSFFFGKECPYKKTMIYKLILIPFYIINFCLWGVLIAGLLNPFLFWSIFIILPLSVGFTYAIMVTSGSYNIAYLLCRRIKNEVKTKHIIFHFIFVIDVIDSIYLGIKKNA